MAFFEIEPFGSIREDQRAGMITALIANVNRDPAKRAEPYDVEDFFPSWETRQAGQRQPQGKPSNLKDKLMAWAESMKNNGPATGKAKPKKG